MLRALSGIEGESEGERVAMSSSNRAVGGFFLDALARRFPLRRSSLYVLPIVQDVLRRSQGFFRRSCPRRRWFKKFPQDVALGLLLNALPVLMLATGFFWSRSLDVFHYFRAAKASQDGPQDGAMLDLVLGSIFDRFWEVFLDVLGASWGHLGDVLGRLAAQIGAMLELVLGSIFV